jgi:hypothetical protein
MAKEPDCTHHLDIGIARRGPHRSPAVMAESMTPL